MGMLAKIMRMHFRDGMSLREAARSTGLSRYTIRGWLRRRCRHDRAGSPDRARSARQAGTNLKHLRTESRMPCGFPLRRRINSDTKRG